MTFKRRWSGTDRAARRGLPAELPVSEVASAPVDVHAIRGHFAFPRLGRIALNNAASTQPPEELLALYQSLAPGYENVHRGQSSASQAMTTLFEESYDTIARFIGAPGRASIVLYRNATEAVNAVMYSLLTEFRDGDNVVATLMERVELPGDPDSAGRGPGAGRPERLWPAGRGTGLAAAGRRGAAGPGDVHRRARPGRGLPGVLLPQAAGPVRDRGAVRPGAAAGVRAAVPVRRRHDRRRGRVPRPGGVRR